MAQVFEFKVYNSNHRFYESSIPESGFHFSADNRFTVCGVPMDNGNGVEVGEIIEGPITCDICLSVVRAIKSIKNWDPLKTRRIKRPEQESKPLPQPLPIHPHITKWGIIGQSGKFYTCLQFQHMATAERNWQDNPFVTCHYQTCYLGTRAEPSKAQFETAMLWCVKFGIPFQDACNGHDVERWQKWLRFHARPEPKARVLPRRGAWKVAPRKV